MRQAADSPLPTATPQSTAVQRLVRIATDALPPELAHLAAGPLAESLAKAVAVARHGIARKKIFEPGPMLCYHLIAKTISPVCKGAKSRVQPVNPQFR
jgi:hypothetical protein